MSRVGKAPVKIQQGVKVDVKDRNVRVEGPKGKLALKLPEGVDVKVENGHILVTADAKSGALRGSIRATIQNLMTGAHVGFTRGLDIVGVGYKAALKGKTLSLNLGFSHPIDYDLPEGITVAVEKNTHLVVSGCDKVLLGMVCAKIRSFRPPEPYQGKGVKYTDERIVRKVGKAAGAK